MTHRQRKDGEYLCEGVTAKARACERVATVHLYDSESTCGWHYCTQHAAGAGVMRLLLPRAWEYHHIERGRQ